MVMQLQQYFDRIAVRKDRHGVAGVVGDGKILLSRKVSAMSFSQRRRLYCSFVVAVPLFILTVLVFLIYSCNHPRDRVTVTVTGAPVDVTFACPVAETRGQVQVMKLYRSHIFGPFVMSTPNSLGHPRDDDESRVAGDFSDLVAWLPGERYGVVTGTKTGRWRVTWFDARAVHLTDHSTLTGGGFVVLDLRNGQTENLTEKEAMNLGLTNWEYERERSR